jgi:hypothetical protein
MQAENIALIETGGSHDECLYSQVLFLKKYGHRIHILLFEDHYEQMDNWPEVDRWQTWPVPEGFAGEWRLVFRILKYLRRNNIKRAVINTAEGNIVRKLSIASGRNIDFAGLIHLSRKLWTSRSQRIISRTIKKYLVLAEFIKENLKAANPGLDIEHFYPVYFPETGGRNPNEKEASGKGSGINGQKILYPGEKETDFLVCIPGAVEYARRDYTSLLNELRDGGVPAGIRFILLGRTTGPDGRDLLGRIREGGFESHFTTFEGFVTYREFYANLLRSHLVLPLISPGSVDYDDYLRYKITGTYNLAWGFGKPMLMHSSFEGYRIFSNTSVFYETGKMLQVLEKLFQRRDKLKTLQDNISEMEEFDFDAQAERYVNFILR